MSQKSTLAGLPRELLDLVAKFLPTTDFNNMRLTCKLVENKLFPYWSNTFFKKKQFMITAFSLQTLVDISRHITLGPCITHLVIGLDHLATIHGSYLTTKQDYEQCHYAADLQESLLDTGGALQLLSTAFLNLRNLSTIGIRDFNSNTRYRDMGRPGEAMLPDAIPAWRSYGYSELKPWSRCLNDDRPMVNLGSMSFVSRVFKVVLAALSHSPCPIRGLEVVLRRESLRDSAFAIGPLLDNTSSQLPVVLSGLTKLHLDVNLNHNSFSRARPWYYPASEGTPLPKSASELWDPATTNLRNFLSLTPNVTWLRLNVSSGSVDSAMRLLGWLALDLEKPVESDVEARWSLTNPKPVSLPLQRLDIGGVNLSFKLLSLVVQKFGKLKSLCFRRVHIIPDREEDDEIDNIFDSVWGTFFRELPFIASQLEHLELKDLTEPDGASRSCDVVFTPATGIARNSEYVRELSVANKAALQVLPERTWTYGAWKLSARRVYRSGVDDASMDGGDDASLADNATESVDDE